VEDKRLRKKRVVVEVMMKEGEKEGRETGRRGKGG
jgi:hypothetical protein